MQKIYSIFLISQFFLIPLGNASTAYHINQHHLENQHHQTEHGHDEAKEHHHEEHHDNDEHNSEHDHQLVELENAYLNANIKQLNCRKITKQHDSPLDATSFRETKLTYNPIFNTPPPPPDKFRNLPLLN